MSKNRFDLEGTLNRIEKFETKAGKTMLTLIVDVDKQSKYPKIVPVKIFGRTADAAGELRSGDILSITGRLGGRDWNGRVFGDIVAESIEVIAAGKGDAPKGNDELPPDDDGSNVPF
jgi:hypothetical protein